MRMEQNMKPLGFRPYLPYFAIPALALATGFYLLMPALIHGGMLPYYAYSLGLAACRRNGTETGFMLFYEHKLSNGTFDNSGLPCTDSCSSFRRRCS